MVATEVTKYNGTRFVSLCSDLALMALRYPQSDGYQLRLVNGQITAYGFKIESDAS